MTNHIMFPSCQTLAEAQSLLEGIGSDAGGIRIMREKAIFRVVRLQAVPTKAANLIKQAFLARGADAAVSRHSADLSEAYTDVLIFATLRQYQEALARMRLQPWGLRELADELETALQNSLGNKQEFRN